MWQEMGGFVGRLLRESYGNTQDAHPKLTHKLTHSIPFPPVKKATERILPTFRAVQSYGRDPGRKTAPLRAPFVRRNCLPSYGDSVKSTPITASEAATATLSTWAGWKPVALAATE